MILIDFNGVAIGNITAMQMEVEESLIRHMVLNSIRMYRKKYKAQYGEIVVCCDAGGNWRREVFPHYKAKRRKDVKESKHDWAKIWEILNTIREEIAENMPWKVLNVHGCEADDIIGVLADYTNEFGNYEDVMICSADKDFAQLQKYSNVKQFSTMTKKPIVEKNPRQFLFQHTCKGDASDGVPNVMSPDDIFLLDGVRQGTMFQKKIDEWAKADDLRKAMGEDIYRNYMRNKKMIDLAETPPALREEIINSFESQTVADPSKVMPYLMNKRCRGLLEVLNDFI